MGDSVRIQDMRSGRWNKSGVIEEVRQSDDGQSVSFIIELPDGRKTIRHRSHLRFNINRYSRISDRKVKFNLDVNRDGEEKKKKQKKKVVKPLTLKKAESAKGDWQTVHNNTNEETVKPLLLKKSTSAECDWEIADKNANEETGISSRTRSKSDISMPSLKECSQEEDYT